MSGTDMNAVAVLMQNAIQTQQNAVMRGCTATAVSSKKTGADFEECMKVSTMNNEEEKNVRSMEQSEAGQVKNVQETKVMQTEGDEPLTTKEPMENQLQNAEDIMVSETEQKQFSVQEVIHSLISQKFQDLLSETDMMENTSEVLPKALVQELAEIKDQIMQKIMENFDVTEEEVEEAMEVLAINIVDLLQTDKLKELAVYISGEESLVSLVTNADMYNAYKEVVAGIEEVSVSLMDKFSVTPEELQEILSQLKEVPTETIADAMVQGKMTDMPEEVVVETMEQSLTEFGKVEEQSQVPGEVFKATESQRVEEDNVSREKGEVQINVVTSQNTETDDSPLGQQNEYTSNENGNEVAQNTNDNVIPQTNTSYSTVVAENEVQTVVKTQRTDLDGIVRQIVEQIKVEIKPDVTSMELQLNPENLGKVNLQVTSKEGAITAQLFVQNETVKTMVESQLMVLREAMNEQGVKVEAVEVTVETGQFGRSLEQHSEQRKQETEKQAKSYQHRILNLLAGIDEESMNAEEMLKAHLMRESGNSVDMNA